METILFKMLQSLVAENIISFMGCLIQVFVFAWVLSTDLLLLGCGESAPLEETELTLKYKQPRIDPI